MAATVEELKKNCGGCKKQLKKARRYYRDGAYFCNLRCYKKKLENDATAAAEAKA